MEDLTLPFCGISLQSSSFVLYTLNTIGIFLPHNIPFKKSSAAENVLWACNMLLSFELPVCILTFTESSLRNRREIFVGLHFKIKFLLFLRCITILVPVRRISPLSSPYAQHLCPIETLNQPECPVTAAVLMVVIKSTHYRIAKCKK